MPLSTPQPQPQPTAPRGRHPDASTGRRRALVALSSLLVLGMLGFGVLGFGPLGAGRIERIPPSSVGSHVGGSQSGTRDGKPNASAERPRLLVFTKTAGFRHDSIPTGIAAVRELLSDRFEIDATEDAAVFEAANLARYRAVVFLSTTGDILDEAQQRAFEGFIRSGGGFAGIHAAADTEHTWPWYGKLVGAYFKTHPDIQEALVRVEDKRHPSTVMLPTEWRRTDEWYVYSSNPRSRVQVLASVDDSTIQGVSMGGDHPIAWFHVFEGGRSWYTGGGHTHESFAEPLFRAHIEGGILWAAGAADIVTAGESDKPADGAGHAAPARESGKVPRDAPAADKPPAAPRWDSFGSRQMLRRSAGESNNLPILAACFPCSRQARFLACILRPSIGVVPDRIFQDLFPHGATAKPISQWPFSFSQPRMGSRAWEAAHGKPRMGSRAWEAAIRKPRFGSREWAGSSERPPSRRRQ